MEIRFIIEVAAVLVFGSALQSAVGFGFGLFAIPLLIILGNKSYEAIAVISICSAVQNLVGAYSLRRHIRWRQILPLMVLAATMVPLGAWLLHRIHNFFPETVIRQLFGAIVLLGLLAQWAWRVRPREQLHTGWGVAAAALCGFLAGLSGMGGPPLVMWVMAHRWSNQRSRATLWTLFISLTPFQVLFLSHEFGSEALFAFGRGLLFSPVTLLGILPGLWLGHRFSKPALRKISYLILLLISLYAVLQPLLAEIIHR